MKRIPIFATLIVLLAAGLMIRLGLWQINRAAEKTTLLARYQIAASLPVMAYPGVPTDEAILFRRAGGLCLEPVEERVEGGKSASGRAGWRHIIACRTGAEGPGMTVDIGWSADFRKRSGWKGGPVEGVIATLPDHASLLSKAMGNAPEPGLVLIATKPAPGLEASAPPNLADVANNHLSYAVQWFIFAGLAVGIYGLALWRRGMGRGQA